MIRLRQNDLGEPWSAGFTAAFAEGPRAVAEPGELRSAQDGAVVALRVVHVVAAGLFTGAELDGLDAAFPSAFVRRLQAGEADGPLGDPLRRATGTGLRLLCSWLAFAPFAIRLWAPMPAEESRDRLQPVTRWRQAPLPGSWTNA